KTRPFIHACDVDAYRKLLEKFARKMPDAPPEYLPSRPQKSEAERAAFTRQMEDLALAYTGHELERRRAALEAEFHGTREAAPQADSSTHLAGEFAAKPIAEPSADVVANGRRLRFPPGSRIARWRLRSKIHPSRKLMRALPMGKI